MQIHPWKCQRSINVRRHLQFRSTIQPTNCLISRFLFLFVRSIGKIHSRKFNALLLAPRTSFLRNRRRVKVSFLPYRFSRIVDVYHDARRSRCPVGIFITASRKKENREKTENTTLYFFNYVSKSVLTNTILRSQK